MAKTYTLTATSVNAGMHTGWTNGDWRDFYSANALAIESMRRPYVGRYGSSSPYTYRAVNILFDQSVLASLRTKTITSIKLTVTLVYGTLYANSSAYKIGYKLDAQASTSSTGSAWTRSDANSSASSTTVVAGYLSTSSRIEGNNQNIPVTVDLTGSTIPKYGYTIGTDEGLNASIILGTSATLTVVTNETDYTLTLSYNANNGSGAPSSQSATVTTTGTPSKTFTISSTRPTRTGYNFLGWSTSSTATSASYQPSGSITISSNTTLYAVWQRITYTVAYNKGSNGTGTNTSDTKTYGVNLTLKGAIFSRTGYTQTGWSTSDGGGLAYGLSATYSANAAVTLYPYWTINTYAVSYNKGSNGTGSNTSDTKTYGTALTLKGAIFTRTGYTQTGWSTSDGGSKAYNLSASYTSNAAITLYPFWTINTYTISYNKGSNGTGTNTSDTKTYGTALTLKGAIFTRTGYYQSGWSTSDGGSQTYALSASYTSNAATTLYPVWTAYTVTVQYNANGGSLASTHASGFAIDSSGYITLNGSRNFQILSYGASTDPWNYNNPEGINIYRTGYHINDGIEWNTAANGSGTSFDQDVVYTATDFASNVGTGNRTIVLYANWKVDTYTISYNANGGSGAPSEQTKTYGVNLTLSSTVPTREGYDFLGWATSSTATTATYQPGGTFTTDASTILYAVWGRSAFIRIMGSDGTLKSAPLYIMTSSGLRELTLYKMGSDGILHQQE